MEKRPNNSMAEDIRRRFLQITDNIAKSAATCNRSTEDIRLVVVTKSKSMEVLVAVIQAGCMDIGENYVEEALPKIEKVDNKSISWHMIGHIQSRKTRLVCENFDWVHSLDRIKIGKRLNRFMSERGKQLPVLLECNVSGEESKFGFPAWSEELWRDLENDVEQLIELPNLSIQGLMTIPPWDPDPEAARPYYRRLNKLRCYLADSFPNISWNELSMGMSNDYQVAIEEGATIVRIGTAIVGERIR